VAEPWKKLLASSAICHLVAYGVLLLIAVFSYTSADVLVEFQWDWITASTMAEFLRLAPVSQGWATILVFAWIVPMGATPRASTSFDRFGRSIALLLVLTLVFAVSFLVGYPRAASRVESYRFTSTLARQLRDSAARARADQNYTRALSELTQYLVLVGESEEIEETLIEVREQARRDEIRLESQATESVFRIPDSATAEELLDRATAAFQREDYSTAHYIATLARSLEPTSDEAARLAAGALAELETLAPDDLESDEATLFRRKQEAKAALTRGDFVGAYYDFAALAEEYPRDVDVRRYLRAAEDRVVSLAVFQDEVESAMQLPGSPDVVFVNRFGPDSVELVAIGKLVRTNSGVYGQQIELIETRFDGQIVRQITSDYGKLSDGYFIMNVIRRGAEVVHARPTVHVGAPTVATEGLLEIVPSPDDLWLLASVSRNPATADIASLSRTVDALDRYGLITQPVELEFLMRLATPFGFLIVSLVLIGFGWRFRSRYLHLPPLPTLASIPIIPLFILPVFLGLQYAQRIVVSAMLLSFGLTVAVLFIVVLQALLLILALTYVALGTRE